MKPKLPYRACDRCGKDLKKHDFRHFSAGSVSDATVLASLRQGTHDVFVSVDLCENCSRDVMEAVYRSLKNEDKGHFGGLTFGGLVLTEMVGSTTITKEDLEKATGLMNNPDGVKLEPVPCKSCDELKETVAGLEKEIDSVYDQLAVTVKDNIDLVSQPCRKGKKCPKPGKKK